MTRDSPENALADAKVWLSTAKSALAAAGKEPRAEVVAAAEAIHSIIRANDALLMAFLGEKATRHDQAALLFMRLVRSRKLCERDARFATLLAKAVAAKSGADYGRGEISREGAEFFVKGAEEFALFAESRISAEKAGKPFR